LPGRDRGWTVHTSAVAQKKCAAGVNDTAIKISQTAPFSEPDSSFSAVASVEAAYIKLINDHGGMNKHAISLI
jgi:hypothetical protein